MKKLSLIFLVITVACSRNKNTSYRVLDRNGKVVYFDNKRTPKKNIIIKENKNELNSAVELSKKVKSDIKNNNNYRINDNLVLDSSAYTLGSVVDKVVKQDDISSVAKMVEKNRQDKTINDFDIPEYYFNSNIPTKEELEINKRKIEDLKKKNSGFFAKLFSRNKSKNDKPVKKDYKIVDSQEISNVKDKQNITGTVIFNQNQKTGKNNYNSQNIKKDYKLKNESQNHKSDLNNISKDHSLNKDKYVLSSNVQINKTSNFLEKNKYYIQIGSFKNIENSNNIMKKFKDVGYSQFSIPVKNKNETLYKAVIGTFSSKKEAEKEMEKILERGHFDCYVFKN